MAVEQANTSPLTQLWQGLAGDASERLRVLEQIIRVRVAEAGLDAGALEQAMQHLAALDLRAIDTMLDTSPLRQTRLHHDTRYDGGYRPLGDARLALKTEQSKRQDDAATRTRVRVQSFCDLVRGLIREKASASQLRDVGSRIDDVLIAWQRRSGSLRALDLPIEDLLLVAQLRRAGVISAQDELLESSLDEPVRARADARYPVIFTHGTRLFAFEVTFTEAAAALLNKHGKRVSPWRGTVHSPMQPLNPEAAFSYRAERRVEPPPWVMKLPGAPDYLASAFFVPSQGVTLDTSGNDLVVLPRDLVHLDVELFMKRTPQAIDASDLEPIRASDYAPYRESVGAEVTVVAPNAHLAGIAAACVRVVCSRGLEARQRERDSGHAKLKVLRELRSQRDAGQISPDDFSNRTREVFWPNCEFWKYSIADGAVAALEGLLRLMSRPVEVIVVPKGKHYTAMPEHMEIIPHKLDRTIDPDSIGKFDATPDKLLVFIPEDDLVGALTVIAHELTHLVVDGLNSSSRQRQLQDLARANRQRGGPVADYYALKDGEHATVHAEEYYATHGDDGPHLLERHMEDLYRFLEELLGPPVRLRDVVTR